MLRVHVVRGEGYRYYVDDLVPGRAEGSLVAGESPGVWSGQGAEALGLDGQVRLPEFRHVLEGRDPRSGQLLRQPRGRHSVAGFDLTFCAPKSVSLLHLLGPGEIAAEVGAGHQAAVDEAAAYLGRSAVGVRRYRHGERSLLASTGAVAGQFVHRTSRALDPHLHTHLVAANVAQGVDGAWSSVDSRRVFAHAPAAQGVYHARLRFELSVRLGAAWDVPASGLGDVVGVDPRLSRLFSTRRASIDQYHHEHPGADGHPRRRAGAFHATRPDKDRSHTVDQLLDDWRQRAADFGFDLGDLTRTVGLGRSAGTGAPGGTFDADRLRDSLARAVDHHRSLSHRDLVAVVATSATRGAPAEVIESAAERLGRASARSETGPLRDRSTALLGEAALLGETAVLGTTAHEPRWSAPEVLRALDHGGERVLEGGSDAHAAPGERGGGWRVDRGVTVVDRGGLAPWSAAVDRAAGRSGVEPVPHLDR